MKKVKHILLHNRVKKFTFTSYRDTESVIWNCTNQPMAAREQHRHKFQQDALIICSSFSSQRYLYLTTILLTQTWYMQSLLFFFSSIILISNILNLNVIIFTFFPSPYKQQSKIDSTLMNSNTFWQIWNAFYRCHFEPVKVKLSSNSVCTCVGV